MTQLGDGWPVVGRDAELDRLTRLLVDAESSDQPAVVVVEGELGVGKTRPLPEIIEFLTSKFGPYPQSAAGGIYINESIGFSPETLCRLGGCSGCGA